MPRLPTAIQGDGVPLLILWGLFPASPVFPAVPQKLTKLVASLYESRSVSEEDLDELAAFIREKTGGGQ